MHFITRITVIRSFAFAAVFCAPLILSAQVRPATQIDSVDAYIARVMVAQQVPGVTVAVV